MCWHQCQQVTRRECTVHLAHPKTENNAGSITQSIQEQAMPAGSPVSRQYTTDVTHVPAKLRELKLYQTNSQHDPAPMITVELRCNTQPSRRQQLARHLHVTVSQGFGGPRSSSSFSCTCICITNHFFSLTDTAASASAILPQQSSESSSCTRLVVHTIHALKYMLHTFTKSSAAGHPMTTAGDLNLVQRGKTISRCSSRHPTSTSIPERQPHGQVRLLRSSIIVLHIWAHWGESPTSHHCNVTSLQPNWMPSAVRGHSATSGPSYGAA
jgi:hypothetical protein